MDKKLEGIMFIMHGGSWRSYNRSFMRATSTLWINPSFKVDNFGFRCCKPAFYLKQVKRWKDETEGGLFDD